jgi:hypothetical protein
MRWNAEMVEDAVYRGLEGGDHRAIYHEFGYYDFESNGAKPRTDEFHCVQKSIQT